MAEPKSLYSDEITEARNEWRNALSEVAPKVPFGPNYQKMLKDMQKDPRVTEKVVAFRKFYHMSEEGMDEGSAQKAAVNDINEFSRTFGEGK